MDEFKKTGFYGSDFSENSLRWLMTAFLLREKLRQNLNIVFAEAPDVSFRHVAEYLRIMLVVVKNKVIGLWLPIKYLIEEKKLRTDWKPSEIGTDFAVLNK